MVKYLAKLQLPSLISLLTLESPLFIISLGMNEEANFNILFNFLASSFVQDYNY